MLGCRAEETRNANLDRHGVFRSGTRALRRDGRRRIRRRWHSVHRVHMDRERRPALDADSRHRSNRRRVSVARDFCRRRSIRRRDVHLQHRRRAGGRIRRDLRGARRRPLDRPGQRPSDSSVARTRRDVRTGSDRLRRRADADGGRRQWTRVDGRTQWPLSILAGPLATHDGRRWFYRQHGREPLRQPGWRTPGRERSHPAC